MADNGQHFIIIHRSLDQRVVLITLRQTRVSIDIYMHLWVCPETPAIATTWSRTKKEDAVSPYPRKNLPRWIFQHESRYAWPSSWRVTISRTNQGWKIGNDRRYSARISTCARARASLLEWRCSSPPRGTLSGKFWNFKSAIPGTLVLSHPPPSWSTDRCLPVWRDSLSCFSLFTSPGIVVGLWRGIPARTPVREDIPATSKTPAASFGPLARQNDVDSSPCTRSAHVARRRQPRRHSARPFVPRDDRRWFVAGLGREQFPDFYVRGPEDAAPGDLGPRRS